ncbi:PREDICTED: glutathione S-transferase T3-like [Brassica oleracea var. oleracea]|uniref:glutathione S-transferase T3-like n=1 Tax=Brassica oleracea var. oleracea TaxID=109376 RepID=UPI0006A744AA|nr:PREDICTED: glutathione S-transferase T3-like [Brassica oleracea var. oleracea]
MDTFSLSSPGFVNLLSSQSSQTVEVGSSEVPKPAAERRKWTTQEDIVLISAWLNTSKDPIVSNQQKLFWRRIEDYFNASAQLGGFPPREWSQCKQSYEAALKEQSSGQNENDVMKSAHDIFFNNYQAKFTLEHAWRELRYDQKWRSNSISRDGAKEKMKEAAETVPDSDEARPPGVKACKAAKRKKHGNEAAFDRLESILEKKQNLSKQKILDRLLSKNIASLSEAGVALKDKLVSGML